MKITITLALLLAIAVLAQSQPAVQPFGYLIHDPRWFYNPGSCSVCQAQCNLYDIALNNFLNRPDVVKLYTDASGACGFQYYANAYEFAYNDQNSLLQMLYQDIQYYTNIADLKGLAQATRPSLESILYKYVTAAQQFQTYVNGFQVEQFCNYVQQFNNALIDFSRFVSALSSGNPTGCPNSNPCSILSDIINIIGNIQVPSYPAFDASFTPQTYEAIRGLNLGLSNAVYSQYYSEVSIYTNQIDTFLTTEFTTVYNGQSLGATGLTILNAAPGSTLALAFAPQLNSITRILAAAQSSIVGYINTLANTPITIPNQTFFVPNLVPFVLAPVAEQKIVDQCLDLS